MVDVRKASSASRSASSGSGDSSTSMPAASASSSTQRAGHPEQAARATRAASPPRRRARRTRWSRWPRTARRACSAKIASLAPRSSRVRERAHVLGVRRGLEPRGRAAVVAHPRHDDDAHRVGPRARTRCSRRRPSAAAPPRSEPSGATPPVTVMRRRASSWPLARSTAHAAACSVVAIGDRRGRGPTRSAPAGRGGGSTRTARRRRRGWSRTRRRRRAARGRRGRSRASSIGEQRAVDPHRLVARTRRARRCSRRGGRASVSAPATARSRAALSSVSAHSASGRESATMPPPTEKCVLPRRTCRAR